MKNYEVTLSRSVTQKVHTTVSVFAETDEEAAERAIKFAKKTNVKWAGGFSDPAEYGEIHVENIEAIVDLNEEVAE